MSLILVGKNIYTLSDYEIKNADEIFHLDVSNNFLKFGKDFFRFKNLKTLVIDHNAFSSLNDFPKMPSLITFSANNNQFSDFNLFCVDLSQKFPNLCHISLLKNPLCPFFEANEKYYIEYKSSLFDVLPNLKNIDGIQVDKKDIVLRVEKEEEKIDKKFENQEDIDENENDKVFKGTIEYNEKYKYKNPSKNIKTKSEGNRFLKNDQL